MLAIRKTILLLLLFALQTEAKDLKVFGVGNSLTDGLRWKPIWSGAKTGGLLDYVASSGHNTMTGKVAVIAGAPLSWTWNEPSATNLYQALTNSGWDVLTLQPYDRMLYDPHYPGSHSYDWGDVSNAVNFIRFALVANPDIQVYIYSHWPSVPDYSRHGQFMALTNPATGTNYTWTEADNLRQQALAAFDFDACWNALYTNETSGLNCRTRSYFEQLTAELDKQQIVLAHPIRLIPVGDVMYALNQKMKNGEISGFTDIKQAHQDVPHLRPGIGRLIMAATWYAALFQESPEGLDYTQYNGAGTNAVYKLYGDLDDDYYVAITPAFAAAVQQTAWEVVSTHPYAGVAPLDHDRDGIPNVWEYFYFGGSTNANPEALSSNGVNTVREAWIAGLDPSGSGKFQIQNINGGSYWNAVSGRVYDVYYTTNLLTGFHLLRSNLSWEVNSFTNSEPGFYRINVRLP